LGISIGLLLSFRLGGCCITY